MPGVRISFRALEQQTRGRRPGKMEERRAEQRVLVRLGDCTARGRVEGGSPLAAGEDVFGGCGAPDELLARSA